MERIRGPRPTVLLSCDRLSHALGLELVLAIEAMQHTGSFKFRAAHNLAGKVPNDHLLTASSGNFGQALALSARLTEKRCTVVMPTTAATVKIDAVRSHGAEVDLIDTSKVSRDDRIAELRNDFPDAYYASPFDDALVVEGNASLGLELANCDYRFDAVLAPIGGGGLTSGLVQTLPRTTAVVPCEPAMANDFVRSLRQGRLISNEGEPPTLADGARTRRVGDLNWEILRAAIEEALEVSEEGIRTAVRMLFAESIKAEPTGALALAGLLESSSRFRGQTVCCVVSGGNVDASIYAKLIS